MKDDELKGLDFGGWPLPDEYLVEIGRISTLWSSLESFLNMCLGKLAGFDNLGDPTPFILFNHSNFPQRVDILGSLCEYLVPACPGLKDYKAVIGALKTAQKLRNTYAHNQLSLNSNSGNVEMAIGSARGTLNFSVQELKLVDVRRASVAINQAHRALHKLVLNVDIPAPWEKRKAGT